MSNVDNLHAMWSKTICIVCLIIYWVMFNASVQSSWKELPHVDFTAIGPQGGRRCSGCRRADRSDAVRRRPSGAGRPRTRPSHKLRDFWARRTGRPRHCSRQPWRRRPRRRLGPRRRRPRRRWGHGGGGHGGDGATAAAATAAVGATAALGPRRLGPWRLGPRWRLGPWRLGRRPGAPWLGQWWLGAPWFGLSALVAMVDWWW